MRQNEGPADRVIRVLLAIVLGYAATMAAGLWVWIAGAMAVLMLVTAIVGFCPTYTLFGINTRGVRREPARSA